MLQVSLKVLGGKHDGEMIALTTPKFLIGREMDCHLRPNSDMVSRHHCAFAIDDHSVRIRDLGSTNGTLVNGERVRGVVQLNDGDTVAVGKLAFQVMVGDPAAKPAADDQKPSTTSPLQSETAELSTEETQYELPALSDVIEQAADAPHPAESSASVEDTQQVPAPQSEANPAHQQQQQPAPPQPAPAGQANPAQYPGAAPYPYPYPPPHPGYYPPPGMGYPPPMGGYYPQYPHQPYPYPQPVVMGQPVPGHPGYPPPGADASTQPPPPEQQQPQQQSQGETLPEVRLPDPNATGAADSSAESKSDENAPPPPSDERKPSDYAADIIRQHLHRRPDADE